MNARLYLPLVSKLTISVPGGTRVCISHLSSNQFLALVLLFGLPVLCCQAQQQAEPACQKGVLIELRGIVSPRMEKYLERKLERARSLGADLVVLDIDSPGGYLDSSLNIAARLRDLHWAHTVAYVPREALSGAAILSLGCDEIVMAANARFGDAGPIFQGPDALFRHAPEKIRSDLARQVRDLAEAKGRPPALAEAMVDMNLAVYRMTNTQTGDVTFMSEHEIRNLDDPKRWTKGKLVFESREAKFLEVNGRRAVELQLASAVVPDRAALDARYRLQQPLIILSRSGVDTAVYVLNLPIVTGLLFVVGLIALYVEVSAPGIGVGGLTAGLCFTLFFWSRFLGGTAGWLEVILFIAGLVFLGIELFVIPGFGVAGVTGLLLLLAAVVMASQSHIITESSRDLTTLTNSLLVVFGAGAVFVAAVAVLTRYYGSIPLFNRLVLQAPTGDGQQVVDGGARPMDPASDGPVQIGDQGIAESPLRPAGKAIFHNDYIDVVTDGSFVEAGRPVRVIQIQGNRIVVREFEGASE